MPQRQIYMIAGLGNPGKEYSQTRHNIGFTAVEELARRYSLNFSRSRFDAEIAKGRFGGNEMLLVKPQSYMNRSGFPVQKISAYFKVEIPHIIIAHDELDLPFGRIMIVKDRGHGGHNGIRSIIDVLGARSFIRVRIGVGRPTHESGNVTGHVLGRFGKDEKSDLDTLVSNSADACELILSKGVQSAMNVVNSNSS